MCVCVCVCVCVCLRGKQGHTATVCLQTHTSIVTVSVTRLCSPLGLELMVKLSTLLTVFTFILKAEARDYGKGSYISDAACGVRPITMHRVSWPIRADRACWGLCRKQSIWEGHRGPTIMYSIWKIMFFEHSIMQNILLHQIHKIMIFKKASYDPFKTSHVTRRPSLKRFSGMQVQLLSLWMGKNLILQNCSLSLQLNFIFEIPKEIWQQQSHKCCFFRLNGVIKLVFQARSASAHAIATGTSNAATVMRWLYRLALSIRRWGFLREQK